MKLKELLNQYSDVEITKEQEEQIKEYLGIKPKKWKPKFNEKYYYIDSYGDIMDSVFARDREDKYRLSINNCFETSEEAQFRLEQLKVYYELKNFADENNDKIDWTEIQYKYHICIDLTDPHQCLLVNQVVVTQHIGPIYFSSKHLAQQAIDKIGANRIKKYLFGGK